MLKHGVDPTKINPRNGHTYVHLIAKAHDIESFKYILAHETWGPHMRERLSSPAVDNSLDPLGYAMIPKERGDTVTSEMIALLVESGATMKEWHVRHAASLRSTPVLKFFIDHCGVDVNQRYDKESLIHAALNDVCTNGKCGRLLVERGVPQAEFDALFPSKFKQDRTKRFSHQLSRILRHNAIEQGLAVDEHGYVSVKALFRVVTALSLDELEYIVAACSKQRFSLVERRDGVYVRANQGHSGKTAACLRDDAMLLPLPDTYDGPCIHGTYNKALRSITKTGLSRMARKHVHFTSQPYGSKKTISGMRTTCQILIHVDYRAAMKAGIKFYMSANEVILSPGNAKGIIPRKYLSAEVVTK